MTEYWRHCHVTHCHYNYRRLNSELLKDLHICIGQVNLHNTEK